MTAGGIPKTKAERRAAAASVAGLPMPLIANATASVGVPTKAEFDAVVTKMNTLFAQLKAAGAMKLT